MSRRVLLSAGWLALLAFVILLSPGAVPPGAAAQSPEAQGPIVGAPVTAVSFDGDLRSLPSVVPAQVSPKLIPFRSLKLGPGTGEAPDPVQQTSAPLGQMPLPLISFAGLSFNGGCTGGQCGAGWPPDTNGDVGPNHFVESVNTSIGIFDKTGTRLVGITFDSFWSVPTGTPCDDSNIGDPVVVYDHLADRWVVSDFAFAVPFDVPVPPFYECIAVSKTGDPVSGGWWFYAVHTDDVVFPDYPKFGLWPDGYYMSTNMFTSSFVGVRVWAFDRNKMIAGQPVTPVTFNLGAKYGGLLPANLRGSSPPNGSPEFFLAVDAPSTDTAHLWRLHFDPVTPSNSWFGKSSSPSDAGVPADIPVAHYGAPCSAGTSGEKPCVPQKLPGEKLDTLGDRLMMQLQYRNLGGTESLWATHTVVAKIGTTPVTGIRWYEIRNPNGTPSVHQQGTFAPGSTLVWRWMPSLAVDKFGNMAVGYSVSSTGMYPAIRFAARLSTDPLNTLGQGEATLISGGGSQINGFHRWGDYSAMTVDPVDDCTFWYTNEYYAATGSNWQTRIGSFRFPACGPTPTIIEENDPGVAYDGWSGAVDGGASGGTFRYSRTANDTASMTFTGSAVTWFYRTGPDEGLAQVLIDGKNKGTFDLYSASPAFGASQTFKGLSTTTSHKILVKVLGTNGGSASDNKVVVDSFKVGATTTEENSKKVQYNTWIGQSSASTSGGTFRYSTTLDDTVKVSFDGSGIYWITTLLPGGGQADVSVDGGPTTLVDLYAPTAKYKQAIPFTGLASGPHTLLIRVRHTKSSAATNYKVIIDAFTAVP